MIFFGAPLAFRRLHGGCEKSIGYRVKKLMKSRLYVDWAIVDGVHRSVVVVGKILRHSDKNCKFRKGKTKCKYVYIFCYPFLREEPSPFLMQNYILSFFGEYNQFLT